MNTKELRQFGLKVTAPRMKILRILEESQTRHLSAEDIYKILAHSDKDVSLATVYRVLTQFQEAGIIVRHHFENNHSVYELNQGTHHDHLVCVSCGWVDEFMDPVIEDRQHDIAKAIGFTLTDHSHYLYGICGQCQNESPPA